MQTNRNTFNALRASRKHDRTLIADELEALCMDRGAIVTERRNRPATLGYCGQTVALRIECNGVGIMVDINDLHGGEWTLIHWFNERHITGEPGNLVADRPVRNFTPHFQSMIGSGGNGRAHHKATSHPRDWYSLAMMLEAGLLLANSGRAFEEHSAT